MSSVKDLAEKMECSAFGNWQYDRFLSWLKKEAKKLGCGVVHNMKFREQIYSKFESMDCVTQAMKESAGYQGKVMFGSGNVNCSQNRIIPAPKTWNFVKKRLAKCARAMRDLRERKR